jgi:short-subunit dehydrogenase
VKRVAIFGATSYIAEHIARLYAAEGAQLFLAGRSQSKLEAIAADLRFRGAGRVHFQAVDLNDAAALPALVSCMLESLQGGVDHVLIAYGILGDQKASEQCAQTAKVELETNFVSPAVLLDLLALHFEKQRSGTIAVISSVAGDAGRRSNYIYGAAKGGLSTFTQGLRSRLHPFGVKVITIKPGPIETPMTVAVKGKPLAPAKDVAKTIHRAMSSGRPDVLFVPSIWRPIMAIVRALPESIKKRLNF